MYARIMPQRIAKKIGLIEKKTRTRNTKTTAIADISLRVLSLKSIL
jgi:hypothetical protein